MHKVVSQKNEYSKQPLFPTEDINWCLNVIYENTIYSFAQSLKFFVEEHRLPTFYAKAIYAILDPDINISSKIKLMTGLALLSTTFIMALNKSITLSPQQFKTMVSTCSMISNFGFILLVGQGTTSKLPYISNFKTTNLRAPDNQQLKKVMMTQIISEIPLMMSVPIFTYSLLAICNDEPTNPTAIAIRNSLGISKPIAFIIGHILISYFHKTTYEESSETVTEFLKDNDISCIWYETINNSHEFFIHYRNAGFFSNIIFLIYGVMTIFQGCDGPQDANGGKSCTNESLGNQLMYCSQLLMLLWLGSSISKSTIESQTEKFPICNAINHRIYNKITNCDKPLPHTIHDISDEEHKYCD